jgi:hypothetical protein
MLPFLATHVFYSDGAVCKDINGLDDLFRFVFAARFPASHRG